MTAAAEDGPTTEMAALFTGPAAHGVKERLLSLDRVLVGYKGCVQGRRLSLVCDTLMSQLMVYMLAGKIAIVRSCFVGLQSNPLIWKV